MSNETSMTLCELVEESIATLIDGGEVDPKLLDHIADCDRCRDLKYEASQVIARMRDASTDYEHPADFEQKLMERLAAAAAEPAPGTQRIPAVISPEAVAVQPVQATQPMPQVETAPAMTVAQKNDEATVDMLPAVSAEAMQAMAAQAVVDAKPIPPEHEKYLPKSEQPKTEEKKVEPGTAKDTAIARKEDDEDSLGVRLGTAMRGRGVKVIALGIVGVASLAAAAAIMLHLRSGGGDQATAGEAWSGKIVAVSSASSDGKGGLEICNASGGSCREAGGDAEIKPGSMLRTDLRTRAHVELADGSRFAVERGTELVLVNARSRQAVLRKGGVVADVTHFEQGPGATMELPIGALEVIGTKFAVTATEDRSTVEVVRGAVRLRGSMGDSVVVRAGEEGTVQKGRGPEVAPANGVADSIAWSERGNDKGDEETIVRGLGELKARKPGEQNERKDAVRLAKHDLKVRIVDSVVRTEIDETFSNETGEVLEGIYRFPLPPDAHIERLALEVDGKLEEGAFVEKDKAAAIWRGAIQNAAPKAPKPRDEIIWVAGPWRDPALLEWQRGGRFELRIFPIPAKGSRRVVLAYTQNVPAVAGVRRYTYPLTYDPSGAAKAGEFNADVQVRGHDQAFGVRTRGYEMRTEGQGDAARLAMNTRSFVPTGDLVIEYALPNDRLETTAWAYRPTAGGDDSAYVALALRPKLPRWAEGKLRDQVIVVDSSRSMVGERYKRATRLAEAIVREMDKQDRVTVMACDTACKTMPQEKAGPGAATAARVRDFLNSVEPEGGSDLVGAVREARKAAGSREGRALRIVYVGDGGPTVGAVRPAHVSQEISRVLPENEGSLTTVAVGSDADSNVLAAMARGGGGVMIPYVPGERATTVAMQVLGAGYGMALRSPVVELPEGLTDVYPKQLDTIRAGGEQYVVARMTSSEVGGAIKLKGKVGGEAYEQSFPIKVVASSAEGNAFVPRLYAATKISELEATRGELAKTELVDLSKKFAVASSYTSLLVLESEAMFKAFGIDHASAAVPTWSGEAATESSSSNGDKDYGAKGEAEEAADDLSEKKDAYRGPSGNSVGGGAVAGNGYGSGPGKMGATSGARAKSAERSAPMADEAWAPPPAAAEPARKAPATIAAPAPTATTASKFPRDDWGRRMVPMRRVWDRAATIAADVTPARASIAARLGKLESDFNANGDSKTRLEALLGAYQANGQLDRAGDLVTRWSGRDALDPGALIARSVLAAREGQRQRAIRILDGLSDLRPAEPAMQNWVAAMFDAMGDQQRACGHRIALAELRQADAAAVAAAVRCARNTGSSALADSLLSDVTDTKVRTAIDKELAKSVDMGALKGDVQIDGTWDRDADLDIALIGKNGERWSWMGEAKGRVTARSATSTRSENLGIVNLPAGDYILEVTRSDGAESTQPVSGTLTVRAVGQTRQIPFTLSGRRLEVGSVQIHYTPRMVPVNEW